MPGGRPSEIDKIIGYRDIDGTPTPVTVADRIVASMQAGNYLETAAKGAGVNKVAVYEWMKVAARAEIRSAGRPDDNATLTDHERRCIAFANAVREAESSWEVAAVTTLEALGRGGLPVEIRTIERGPSPREGVPGPILKETVHTTHLAPDARVIEWRLMRRFPDRYSERIELSGPGGGPMELSMEERAAGMVDVAKRMLKRGNPRKPKKENPRGPDPS